MDATTKHHLKLIRTSDGICAEINTCIEDMTIAKRRANGLKIECQRLVRELYEQYPDIWLAEIKEKCGIKRRHAYKILELSEPEKTSENNETKCPEGTSNVENIEQSNDAPPRSFYWEKIDAELRNDPHRSDGRIAKLLSVASARVTSRRQRLEQIGEIDAIPIPERMRLQHKGKRWETRQLKTFKKSLDLLFNTCEQCTEIGIPPLDKDQKTTAIKRLTEIANMILRFKTHIEGASNV